MSNEDSETPLNLYNRKFIVLVSHNKKINYLHHGTGVGAGSPKVRFVYILLARE
jgi:hypothetical protein